MILVTGASGRVGRILVNELSKNERVKVLVHKEMVKTENVEVIYGDLLDKNSLEKALKDVETIYHLAADVDYLSPKEKMFNINVLGTKNLVELAGDRKIIYLSSTAVMGRKLKEIPASEKTPSNPSNYYGWTKLKGEEMVKKADGIIIRSADVFGPGFTEGYSLILSKLEEGKLPLIGDGKNFIHWVHVNDLVRALLLAKENGRPGEVYIIAGKEVKTIKELFEILCKYLKVEPPKKRASKIMAKISTYIGIAKWKAGGERPKMIPEYIEKITGSRTFDITKARKELEFEPKIDYEEAAKEMVEEYMKLKGEQEEDKVPEEKSEENTQGEN